jgi:hypothetical protein
MKVYRDLTLALSGKTKEQIIGQVDSVLPPIWIRDKEQEKYLDQRAGDEKQYAYSTIKNPDLPNARLWLATNPEGELYVSNIVPDEMGRLSMEEYNSILMSFVNVLKRDSTIVFELTDDEKSLEDTVPGDVADKLRRFSDLANKSTGYSHPCDFDRWLDFVISYHKCECEPALDLIQRWLNEEAGWTYEKAFELICQLEYSFALLEKYDRVS